MEILSVILMIVAMLLTLGTLFAGLIVMSIGGEINKKHGNKMMRLRVIMQFVAVLLFVLAILISGY